MKLELIELIITDLTWLLNRAQIHILVCIYMGLSFSVCTCVHYALSNA